MTDTDDKLKRMSFKEFTVVDYMPGEGEYINYQAQKRHRGTVGEEVEQTDEGIVSRGIAKVKSGHYDRKANKSFKKARGALGYSKGKSIAKGTSDEDGFSKHMKQSNDYERKAKKIRSDAFRKTKKFNSYKSTLRDDPPRPPYKSKLRDDPPELWQKESVEQIDEKVRPLEMTQAKYDSYPKNKKGKSGGKLYIIQNQKSGVTKGGVKFTSLGGGAGTTKVPVKIVKERPYKYEESVESVDEGVLNDIRDFIVAVGAAIPTKKNKKNAKDKALEDQIRMAMEADPEFDKIVRSVVFVRKDGVAAFKQGGRDKLDKYVHKTVDAKVAAKLGTLVKGHIRTMASGEKRNLGQNPRFNKGEKKAKEQGKIVYGDDMYMTRVTTTHAIGKIIKQVARRAYDDAKKEQKNESVEQTDEMSNKLLNRYSDAAKKDSKKDRAKGMRKARNIRTQRANKGLFGSDIGEEVEQVDEATSNYLSKDQLPAKVQRVVTNIFKLAKKEKKRIQRVSVEEVNKKYNIYVELGRDNNDEDFVGKMMGMETGRAKFVEIHPSESVHPTPSVSVKESVEQTDEAFTVAQRIKAKQRMKKMSKRIQMAKKRSMKRAPTPEKLKLRAKKQVKNALVSKWMRGKSKRDLSFSQRQNIEKRLKSASGRIDNMTKKLLPVVRKQDRERRANANSDKKEES
jgi:hypothetical protein